MGQLYLEFDEKELKKNLELFERIQNEKNGDLEEAFKLFADKYANDEMDLALFLRSINVIMAMSGGIPNSIVRYQELLKGILKVKEYMINNNKDMNNIVSIYELLIYIYETMYNFEETIKISSELLQLDNRNKVALLHLVGKGKNIDYAKDLIDNYFSPKIESAIILHNILCYESDECIEYIKLFYLKNEKSFKNEIEKLSKEEQNELFKGIEKFDSLDKRAILSKIDEIINSYKYLIDIIKPYENYINYINQKYGYKLVRMYFWNYHAYSMTYVSLELFQNSLATLYSQRYAISQDIEDKNKHKKLLEESIKNYSEVNKDLLKDPIINLYNIYYADKDYEKCEKLLFEHSTSLKKDCDYNIMLGKVIYQKDKNKDTAKKSLEYFRKAIEQLKSIDTASFEYAMEDILNNVIPIICEMEEKEYIFENNSKVLLQNMYFYHRSKELFMAKAYIVAYNIKAYELCKEIILDYLENSKTIDSKILIYFIKSLHYLNIDNNIEIYNIINKIDFNIYRDTLVDLINEIAGNIVIDNSIEIKNKKVLISLYEIMSVSRKELIVIRLLDYVRNANDYFKKYIKNKKDKDKNWKGETVDIKYKEKKYKLCYSHNSYKEEKGYNSDDYIAINQIRDTLSHGEHKCKVNENVKEAKNAREFIEANFTSIIECLFNVIKENNLLSDERFDSEDF